ncbi:transposase [Ectopseudomonas mendocina]|uniref:transposase n=1 Tax=Ectopseudomonas mendocina TaxID=300 RepID=UPI000DFB7042|nr:transposase [Pseudomonas mendocina]SUD28643.1 transposase [Pseudomonas mendocina]
MTQTRRRFPESFKCEAVDQVLAGTPLRHVAETQGIAESLLGKWKASNSKVTMPFRATASSGGEVLSYREQPYSNLWGLVSRILCALEKRNQARVNGSDIK